MAAPRPPDPKYPRLTGPLFDPKNEKAVRVGIKGAVEKYAPSLQVAVKKAAPVAKKDRKGAPAGQLRDSIKTKVTASKRYIVLSVTSDAVNAKGFPYGAAQNAKGPNENFIDDALAAEAEAVIGAVNDFTTQFVRTLNAGTLPPT